MYGLKYGPKMGKPLRNEKNKNGKTRSQNSVMLGSLRGMMTRITKKLSKHATRTLEWPMDAAMPCKRSPNGITEVVAVVTASHKVPKTSMVVWWVLTNPQGKEWNLLHLKNTKITLQVRIYFDDPLQFGSQVYSYATSDVKFRMQKP